MITLGVGDCSITKGQHRRAVVLWEPFPHNNTARCGLSGAKAAIELKRGFTLTTGLLLRWRFYASYEQLQYPAI
jgi:hypothetical protein